jgi:hypothetical protein
MYRIPPNFLSRRKHRRKKERKKEKQSIYLGLTV